MSDLDAILIIEGCEASEEEVIAAFQALLDSGTVWRLQGFYQRAILDLLEAGMVTR